MGKKNYLGYIIAILSGLAVIGSAFLSLTMTSSLGKLTQGNSLFNEVLDFSTLDDGVKISAILYLVAVLFSFVEIVYAIVGLIFAKKGKRLRVNVTIQRIFGCVVFIFTISMFVFLGVYLSTLSNDYYNFNGIGTFVAVLASLLLVQAEFSLRKSAKKKVEEKK